MPGTSQKFRFQAAQNRLSYDKVLLSSRKWDSRTWGGIVIPCSTFSAAKCRQHKARRSRSYMDFHRGILPYKAGKSDAEAERYIAYSAL